MTCADISSTPKRRASWSPHCGAPATERCLRTGLALCPTHGRAHLGWVGCAAHEHRAVS